ncbi:hypothetical protein PQX77_009463 [Marasmius sp. AFHP31]|nr:hypothetical protein PQX77_009463 [Marasmius sp. AFHP31]
MVSLTDQQSAQRLEEVFGDEEQLRVFLEQKGEGAQNWLDKLQQLTDSPNLNTTPQFRSTMFTVMVRLSKLSGRHPRSLLMQNVHKLGKHPIAAGGFGDVWKGAIRRSESEEQLVCLKVSKVYVKSDLDALFKEYLREAIVWRQLIHPNVLPFLGIFYLKDESQFCLISPWMENGNLLQYLKASQRADVDHLVLVCDVAAGLAYLHGKKVVHGDLKGLNILITPEGRACIGDFGLSRIADTFALHLTTSAPRTAGTVRWLAREILNGTSGPTKESDIYAFACVCYEIYTSLSPFHELPNDAAVIFHVVVSEKRPMRPVGVPELNDGMWDIMEACWNTNSAIRPKAPEVFQRIRSKMLVERRATWFVDHIGLNHLPQQQTSRGAPALAAHNSTQVCEQDWVEPKLEADAGGRELHEQIYSSYPPVGIESERSFVRPRITPLEDAELIQVASSSQHDNEPPPDHGSIIDGQDRAVEQGHRSNTAKDVHSKTISSEEGLDLLLHDLPANDQGPIIDVLEGRSRSQLRCNSRERTTSTASEQVKINERSWLSKWTNGFRDDKEVNTNGAQGELTRLIGFLTATSSEDWALVMDVCERASASETNAKEVVRALRREFKYGEPQAQLSAARLWAIMLRNSTDTFISQSISRKFLDTLENLCISRRTNPVVRERVLDVLGAAAYASVNKDIGFRSLWKKLKPHDKPEEGMPLPTHDAMFNPPVLAGGDQRPYFASWPYQKPQLHLKDHISQQNQQTHSDQDQQPSPARASENLSAEMIDDASKDIEGDILEQDKVERQIRQEELNLTSNRSDLEGIGELSPRMDPEGIESMRKFSLSRPLPAPPISPRRSYRRRKMAVAARVPQDSRRAPPPYSSLPSTIR